MRSLRVLLFAISCYIRAGWYLGRHDAFGSERDMMLSRAHERLGDEAMREWERM